MYWDSAFLCGLDSDPVSSLPSWVSMHMHSNAYATSDGRALQVDLPCVHAADFVMIGNGGGPDSMVNALQQAESTSYLCNPLYTREIRCRIGAFIASKPTGPFLAFDTIEDCIRSEHHTSCGAGGSQVG